MYNSTKNNNAAEELALSMQQQLIEPVVKANMQNLSSAVDNINSAIDILEDVGMYKRADQLLSILINIAKTHHYNDKHKPTNSEAMIKNLLDHGTVFNLSNDGLLDQDMADDLEINEKDMSFEDEL
jgi:hypothetical protein